MSDTLYWLTLSLLLGALLWAPYTVERILRVGLGKALGYAPESGTAGFRQTDETPAGWARRAAAAHANLLESLPIFTGLVLAAEIASPASGGVVLAAQVFFFARLAHAASYVLGIPVVRTLAFFAAWGAILAVAHALLGGA